MSPQPLSEQLLDDVCAALAAGEVIGLPTDTVYGLAVRADLDDACRRVFAMKGRPDEVALPVLVDSVDAATALAHSGDHSSLVALGRAFWPGPLSVVVRRADDVRLSLGGDEATIGLRLPAHDLAQRVIARSGPLAVTSANAHGQPPCTTVRELLEVFGDRLATVIDGGTCNGVPSTVVSLLAEPPRIVREGPISYEDISAALGAEQHR